EKSSKIIVDSKAGNVLYLPLDKLAASQANIPLSPLNNQGTDSTNNEVNELLDARNYIRPTYDSQGRK
ncbi:MAG: FtsH protease activity modulator HflK, partial [Legionella sp.]